MRYLELFGVLKVRILPTNGMVLSLRHSGGITSVMMLHFKCLDFYMIMRPNQDIELFIPFLRESDGSMRCF